MSDIKEPAQLTDDKIQATAVMEADALRQPPVMASPPPASTTSGVKAKEPSQTKLQQAMKIANAVVENYYIGPTITLAMIAYDYYCFITDVQFFQAYQQATGEGCTRDLDINTSINIPYLLMLQAIAAGSLSQLYDTIWMSRVLAKAEGPVLMRIKTLSEKQDEQDKVLKWDLYHFNKLLKIVKGFLSAMAILLSLWELNIVGPYVTYLTKALIQIGVILNYDVWIYILQLCFSCFLCKGYIKKYSRDNDARKTWLFRLLYLGMASFGIYATVSIFNALYTKRADYVVELSYSRVIHAGVCQRNVTGLRFEIPHRWNCSTCAYVTDPTSLSPVTLTQLQEVNSYFGFDGANGTATMNIRDFMNATTICEFAEYNNTTPAIVLTNYPKKAYRSYQGSSLQDVTKTTYKPNEAQRTALADFNILEAMFYPFTAPSLQRDIASLTALYEKDVKNKVVPKEYAGQGIYCTTGYPASTAPNQYTKLSQTMANSSKYAGNLICGNVSFRIKSVPVCQFLLQ